MSFLFRATQNRMHAGEASTAELVMLLVFRSVYDQCKAEMREAAYQLIRKEQAGFYAVFLDEYMK